MGILRKIMHQRLVEALEFLDPWGANREGRREGRREKETPGKCWFAQDFLGLKTKSLAWEPPQSQQTEVVVHPKKALPLK